MSAARQPHVTMFVRNTIADDNRVLKEAAALTAAGYRVTVVGMRGAGLADDEVQGGARLLRLVDNQATHFHLRGAMERRKARLTALAQAWLRRPADKLNWYSFLALNKAAGLLQPLTYVAEFDRAVAAHEDALRADVWYAHDLNMLPIALRLRRKFGGKVVYDSHEYWLDCNNVYTRFAALVWALTEKMLIGQADRVITVSRSIARHLAAQYGIAEPVVVLNTPSYQQALPGRRLAEQFKLEGKFVLVYVGRLTQARGYEQIIEALASVPGAAVVCFGNGNPAYIQALLQMAAAKGVAGRFVHAGSVHPNQIQAAIAGADAGILAVQRGALSYDFALPSKFFEYVFAGLPVVASDLVEVRQLVDEYGLGVLMDERSVESIAAAIGRMIAERATYSGDAWQARTWRFIAAYDWENHKRVLVSLVDELTGRKAAEALT